MTTTTEWSALDTGRLQALSAQINHAMRVLNEAEDFDVSEVIDDVERTLGEIRLDKILYAIAGVGEPSMVATITDTVTRAKAAFAAGTPTAIGYRTAHLKNDANGNDHTRHIITFTHGDDIVELHGISALIRDTSGYEVEVSCFHTRESGVFLNQEKVGKDADGVHATMLLTALGDMAEVMADDANYLPDYPSAQAQEDARALLTQAMPLLDVLRSLTTPDDE